MIRQTILDEDATLDREFSWRGQTVSRIENLSDIVFALALGMLVSSSQVPRTFDDLGAHLVTIVPVALGFAVMLNIWNTHFTYFRRYAYTDRTIIFLNSALLLMVLFVAYPLRFIFDSLFAWLLTTQGSVSRAQMMELDFERSGVITAYFTAGYGIIFLIFSLMYRHVLKHSTEIGLTADERLLTLRTATGYVLACCISSVAFWCALFTPLNGFAGFILCAVWPTSLLVRALIRPKKNPAGVSRRG